MDTKSLQSKDLDESLRLAYDPHLPKKTQNLVIEHLRFALGQMSNPNTYIEKIEKALNAIGIRNSSEKGISEWLLKPVLAALVSAVVIAPISYFTGVSIERSKHNQSDCPQNNSSSKQDETK